MGIFFMGTKILGNASGHHSAKNTIKITKTVGPAVFCDKSILLQVESKHKAEFREAVSLDRSDKLLNQEGNKCDVIWWDKYYDEVKESVNQDVLAGCGHLSLWPVRGPGWEKMLSRHILFFFQSATADRKIGRPGIYVAIVYICLAQRMAHIQICAVWKWRLGRFRWGPCEVCWYSGWPHLMKWGSTTGSPAMCWCTLLT